MPQESKTRRQLIDPIHDTLQVFDPPSQAVSGDEDAQYRMLLHDVWSDKYAWYDETTIRDTFDRIADAIYVNDTAEAREEARELLQAGLFIPGGRIIAGAGTSKRVTLMNCYVNGTVGDSMDSIHEALGNVMFTLQQGGGIGTDFSTLRPSGSVLRRTGKGAAASGPLPFMDQWDATSKTIRSAGDRRGAMMATLADTHPDLPAFIVAKQEKGRWEQFNVSVLVSDAFMKAVELDDDWYLYFNIEPLKDRHPDLVALDFDDPDGTHQYVYSKWKARDLWNMITQNTYEYSEPGVIFIDRVNDLNNLSYCEYISCTNPCGEQPLPPHGTCNLGAVNLARMVRNPFTPDAYFDFDLLSLAAEVGIRFLDNVIDITHYPLEEQRQEELNKRRLGLGITGLADALAQLGLTYGQNSNARSMVKRIMQTLAESAYEASVMLATQRGAFPLFSPEAFCKAPFIKKLPEGTQVAIKELGIRNGLILTIAPTGTTSLIAGNISSGLECVFLHEASRRVYTKDNVWKEYGVVPGYAYRLYKAIHGDVPVEELPPYMVTSANISVDDHLAIQAICQEYIDASVSKTINLPKDISFEDFKDVYWKAYLGGCKGCTTYRPSDIRGSILSAPKRSASGSDMTEKTATEEIPVRPDCLSGSTYKIKWPSWSSALYLTVNHDENGRPFEVFIQSKDARHQEWITALTIMISAYMRRGWNASFIPRELMQVHSTHDSAWIGGKFYGSLVHRIGDVLQQHYQKLGLLTTDGVTLKTKVEADAIKGEICPKCMAPAYIREEGCYKCQNCGHSSCG